MAGGSEYLCFGMDPEMQRGEWHQDMIERMDEAVSQEINDGAASQEIVVEHWAWGIGED